MSDPYRTAPQPEPPDPYVEFAEAAREWMRDSAAMDQATGRLKRAWGGLPLNVRDAFTRLLRGGQP